MHNLAPKTVATIVGTWREEDPDGRYDAYPDDEYFDRQNMNKLIDSTDYYTDEQLQLMSDIYSDEYDITFEKSGDIRETIDELKKHIGDQVELYNERHHFDGGVMSKPVERIYGNFTEDQKSDYNEYISGLSNDIINRLKSLGYNISIKMKDDMNNTMSVYVIDNTINLSYNPLLTAYEYGRFDYIIAHELVHTVTSQAINNVSKGIATEEEKVFADEIWNTIVDLYNNKKFNWNFGFDLNTSEGRVKHTKEFIANVMTNPNLQHALADIKYDEEQNFWSRLVYLFRNLISKFLDRDIDRTYLDKLMNTIGVHIENFSGGNITEEQSLTEGKV